MAMPPPPPGFELQADIPPPPPGFVVGDAAPERAPASRAEYLLNSAKKGVGDFVGLGKAVGENVLGAAFPPARMAFQALEKHGPTFMGNPRKAVGEALGTQDDMKAPDTLTRLGGKGVEFAVAGGPFAAATIARAPNALRAITAELMAAVEGGAASELAGDIGKKLGGEGGKAAGELVGGLAGGISGMATPALVDKLWSVIGPRLSKEGRDLFIKKLAGKELGDSLSASSTSAPNAELARATAEDVKALGGAEFKPTLGQATGAPGVVSREIDVARGTPADLGKYSERATANEAALTGATNAAFPEGGSFVRSAQSTVRTASGKLDQRLDELTRMQEAVAANVRGAPQQQVGDQLRLLRDTAQSVARGAKNAKIDDLYATADRLGISENMDDVVAAIRKLGKSDENVYQTMPPVFGKVLREHGKDTSQLTGRAIDPDLMADAGIGVAKPASFKELHSLWRGTNSQLATAQRTGDNNSAYYLATLKESLGAKLAKFEEQGAGELTAKFKDFNNWFKTKYAPAFYEGVGGRTNARGRFGEAVKPEEITGKFFTPSGIDDFNMITEHLPAEGKTQAAQTLKDGIVGLFREKAVKDGVINPLAAKGFIRANEETLNKVPDIKAALQNPTALADAMAERSVRLKAAQQGLDKTIIGKIGRSENPDAVIQSALTNPKELRALISGVREPAARKAIARGIADGIPQAAERSGVDPLQFILNNRTTLEPVMNALGPKHFENLAVIASGRTILGRTLPPQHADLQGMQSGIEALTGSTPRTIWSQTANTAAGRQSPVSAVLHLLTRFGIKESEKKVVNVMREVIYRPDLAEELVRIAKQPYNRLASNRLAEHLANAGIRATATLPQ